MNIKFFSYVIYACIAIVSFNVSAATIVSGEIYNIDGDGDGLADDSLIQTITFDVTSGTGLVIDSLVAEIYSDLNGDGEITVFDNYMILFQGNTLLTSNDDDWGGVADGSESFMDSRIGYTFGTAGTYSVSVGQLPYSLSEALLGYDQDRMYVDGLGQEKNHGDWQLTFTVIGGIGSVSNVTVVKNVVPVPAAIWLFSTGLLGLVGIARRKRV